MTLALTDRRGEPRHGVPGHRLSRQTGGRGLPLAPSNGSEFKVEVGGSDSAEVSRVSEPAPQHRTCFVWVQLRRSTASPGPNLSAFFGPLTVVRCHGRQPTNRLATGTSERGGVYSHVLVRIRRRRPVQAGAVPLPPRCGFTRSVALSGVCTVRWRGGMPFT